MIRSRISTFNSLVSLRPISVTRAARITHIRNNSSKILRPNQQDAAERKPFDEPKPSKGVLSDYDIYDDLAAPLNNIDGVLENGFQLASGAKVISQDLSKPKGLVLLGSEAFEVDLADGIKGIDKGIVEFDQSVLGIFDVVIPKPDLLVVGLGLKSRIFGPQTTKYMHSLGIQTHVSNTVSFFCTQLTFDSTNVT